MQTLHDLHEQQPGRISSVARGVSGVATIWPKCQAPPRSWPLHHNIRIARLRGSRGQVHFLYVASVCWVLSLVAGRMSAPFGIQHLRPSLLRGRGHVALVIRQDFLPRNVWRANPTRGSNAFSNFSWLCEIACVSQPLAALAMPKEACPTAVLAKMRLQSLRHRGQGWYKCLGQTF